MSWSHWMRYRAVTLVVAAFITLPMGAPSVFAVGHLSTLRPPATAGSVAAARFAKSQLAVALLPKAAWSHRVFEQSGAVVVNRQTVEDDPSILLEIEDYLRQVAVRQGIDFEGLFDSDIQAILATAAEQAGIEVVWYDPEAASVDEAVARRAQLAERIRAFMADQGGDAVLRLDPAWFTRVTVGQDANAILAGLAEGRVGRSGTPPGGSAFSVFQVLVNAGTTLNQSQIATQAGEADPRRGRALEVSSIDPDLATLTQFGVIEQTETGEFTVTEKGRTVSGAVLQSLFTLWEQHGYRPTRAQRDAFAPRLNLAITAAQMVPSDGGVLASDESAGTAGRRLTSVGLENTPENREALRRMLLTTPGLREAGIAAVIMDRDTVANENTVSAEDPTTIVTHLLSQGITPGLKTDEGLVQDPNHAEEAGVMVPSDPELTKLPAILALARQYGLLFTKYRTVVRANDPFEDNMRVNAQAQAGQAKLTQEAGLVPMVEPEVLFDASQDTPGTHTVEESYATTTRMQEITFEELAKAGVWLEGVVLKTSMVLAGTKADEQTAPEVVGLKTLQGLLKTVPPDVAAIAFLSGGQGDTQATANLDAVIHASQERFGEAREAAVAELREEGNDARADAVAALTQAPWPISYSFSRGLQARAISTWGGQAENVAQAQTVMRANAQEVQLARQGRLVEAQRRQLSREEAERLANEGLRTPSHQPLEPIPAPGKDNVTAIATHLLPLIGDTSIEKGSKDTTAERASDAVTMARGDVEHVMAIEGAIDVDLQELQAGGVHETGFVVNPDGHGEHVFTIRDDIEVTEGAHTNRQGRPHDPSTSNPGATAMRAWGPGVQAHRVVPETYANIMAANVPPSMVAAYDANPLDPFFNSTTPHDGVLAAIRRLTRDSGRDIWDTEVAIMDRKREQAVTAALERIAEEHPGPNGERMLITQISDGTVDPARLALAGRTEGRYLIVIANGKSTEGTENWFESAALRGRGGVFGMRYTSRNVNHKVDGAGNVVERNGATDHSGRLAWSAKERQDLDVFRPHDAQAIMAGTALFHQGNVPGDVEMAIAHLTDNPWFNVPGALDLGDGDTVRVWTTRLSTAGAREQSADLWVEVDEVSQREIAQLVRNAEGPQAPDVAYVGPEAQAERLDPSTTVIAMTDAPGAAAHAFRSAVEQLAAAKAGEDWLPPVGFVDRRDDGSLVTRAPDLSEELSGFIVAYRRSVQTAG